jgi:hypothetical protein
VLGSRSLRPRSQEHLFRSLTLSEDAHLNNLASVFAGSPHLAKHVEDVRVTLPGWSAVWSSTAATQALGHLKNIASLTLEFPPRLVYGRRAPDAAGPAALASAGFTALYTLTLSACTFQTRAAHENLLRGLPSLRILALGRGVRCWECLHYRARGARRLADGADATLPHLEHLAFDCASEAGRCLVQSMAPVQLRKIEIKGAGAARVEADVLGDILECASVVEEVDVDLACPAIVEVTAGLSLISSVASHVLISDAEPTASTKARRFAYVPEADTALSHRLEALVDALPSSASSSCVEVLRLRLDARACRGADWEHLGAQLGSGASTIKSVSLVFTSDVGSDLIGRVAGGLRAGLNEFQGHGTRTMVDTEWVGSM